MVMKIGPHNLLSGRIYVFEGQTCTVKENGK